MTQILLELGLSLKEMGSNLHTCTTNVAYV